jgi:predicted metalloprotease with PDZ domain
LHRAGLIEAPGDPVNLVTQYRSIPGHTVQSAADASFNAWIHLYRSDESFNNYHTNYYFKGMVIANLLELEIGHRTRGAKGVDDVMQLIWERTVNDGATFGSEEIRAICEEVAGGSFRDFFERYVFGTADIPFEQFYRLAGYELVVDEAATAQSNRTGYMGAYLGESDGRVVLNGVIRDGPAYRAGVAYGDEIIAVDGDEVAGLAEFRDLMRAFGPGEQVELLVSQFGHNETITMTLGSRSVPVYRLVEVDEPTDVQLAVRGRWLQTAAAER